MLKTIEHEVGTWSQRVKFTLSMYAVVYGEIVFRGTSDGELVASLVLPLEE
jgi:hypothetical protein